MYFYSVGQVVGGSIVEKLPCQHQGMVAGQLSDCEPVYHFH